MGLIESVQLQWNYSIWFSLNHLSSVFFLRIPRLKTLHIASCQCPDGRQRDAYFSLFDRQHVDNKRKQFLYLCLDCSVNNISISIASFLFDMPSKQNSQQWTEHHLICSNWVVTIQADQRSWWMTIAFYLLQIGAYIIELLFLLEL